MTALPEISWLPSSLAELPTPANATSGALSAGVGKDVGEGITVQVGVEATVGSGVPVKVGLAVGLALGRLDVGKVSTDGLSERHAAPDTKINISRAIIKMVFCISSPAMANGRYYSRDDQLGQQGARCEPAHAHLARANRRILTIVLAHLPRACPLCFGASRRDEPCSKASR
jgi:hypothetical protein